jgi:hypothetical protein
MWMTEGIVGLTWEPVMSMDMMARMAMLQTRMRWAMHQHKMWGIEGTVLESVKIRQYISDLLNTIMTKQMQQQAMYPNQRQYCNKWHHLKGKHIWGRLRHPIQSNSGEVKCGTWREQRIHIARCCFNRCSISAATAKSVTHVSFWWCGYVTTSHAQSKGGMWVMGHDACNSLSEGTRFHQSH